MPCFSRASRISGEFKAAVNSRFSFATIAGGVVLLAPACSSFDMFQDYAARGRAFKDEVGRLAAGER